MRDMRCTIASRMQGLDLLAAGRRRGQAICGLLGSAAPSPPPKPVIYTSTVYNKYARVPSLHSQSLAPHGRTAGVPSARCRPPGRRLVPCNARGDANPQKARTPHPARPPAP